MLRDRDASGKLQVNPEKFPLGWEDVTSFIHSLGMKSGLYTSKSQYTCAGFNASCMHEMIDAATVSSLTHNCLSLCHPPITHTHTHTHTTTVCLVECRLC